MARTAYTKETKEQIKLKKEIEKMQKKLEALNAKKRKPALVEIVRTMREYDITPEELAAAFNKGVRRSSSPKRNSAGVKKAKAARTVEPKYRHPDSGQTWTGRGKPPRWITDAQAQGKSRDSFLIGAPTAVEAVAAKVAAPVASQEAAVASVVVAD